MSMKTKPWPIVILALLHILAPVGNFFFNAFRLDHTVAEQWQYWFEIYPKPLLAAGILAPVLAGIFIYLCRKWAYYSYIVCLVVIFGLNIYAFTTSLTYITFLTLLAVTLIDLMVVAYFVVPSVAKIYLDPRMRWWEAAPRYNFAQQGTVNGAPAVFRNLSQGGMLATEISLPGESKSIQIQWEGAPTIQAEIVYKGLIQGRESIGLKFNHDPESEKYIKTLIKKLHTDGQIVKERLPGPEDSFSHWFKKFISSGDGLFPR